MPAGRSRSGTKTYAYYSLPAAEKNGLKGISRLPFSMKVLLENLLRNEDGRSVTKEDIQAVAQWLKTKTSDREIAFRPARVLMQDFTGVPAVVDLAAMRDAMKMLGGDPKKINPLVPVDLVIDHSVVGQFLRQQRRVQEERRGGIQAEPGALPVPEMGAALVRGFPRGAARHRHLPSGQSRISVADGLDARRTRSSSTARRRRPSLPIRTRWSAPTRTPRWSTALSVLGWGVGGIEAEAAMLGQPYSMLLPEVIGVKLHRQAQGRRHRDRSRAHGHADAAQARRGRQVRRIFRRRAWPTCRSRTAPRSATCRPNTAPPAGSSRSTTTPSAICVTPAAPPERVALVARLCQGAGHVPHQDHARSGLHRRAQARTFARSSRRWPDRSARRTACAQGRQSRLCRTSMDKEFGKAAR